MGSTTTVSSVRWLKLSSTSGLRMEIDPIKSHLFCNFPLSLVLLLLVQISVENRAISRRCHFICWSTIVKTKSITFGSSCTHTRRALIPWMPSLSRKLSENSIITRRQTKYPNKSSPTCATAYRVINAERQRPAPRLWKGDSWKKKRRNSGRGRECVLEQLYVLHFFSHFQLFHSQYHKAATHLHLCSSEMSVQSTFGMPHCTPHYPSSFVKRIRMDRAEAHLAGDLLVCK